ncbi:MAG TPA: spore coat U domain-containing protein [Rhizomicrobium sp.]
MRRSLFTIALLAFLPVPAQAICLLGSFTATGLNFGLYNPGALAPAQSQGTISIGCTLSVLTEATIALSKGKGSYLQRTMTMGSNILRYNLYLDSVHTMVWGDGTNGTVTENFTSVVGLGTVNFPVYGLVDAGQYPAPGAYGDTIVVTFTF